MAYHFRKLRQTLRLIPSTKSIGFSTRVNEGDQTKNTHVDGNSTALSIPCTDHREKALLCQRGANGDCIAVPACTVLTSPSDMDLFHQLQPILRTTTTSPPISYKDLVQILIPGHSRDRSYRRDDLDSILTTVKSVDLTTDDILVHPVGHFIDSRTSTCTCYSKREKISVDVITVDHGDSRFPYVTTLPSQVTSSLDNIILNNRSIQTFSGNSYRIPPVHLYCSADTTGQPKPRNSGPSRDGPSPEQMHDAREKLQKLVNSLFKGQHDYEMLHKNVVLENNLFGDNKTAIGVSAYKLELFKLRLRVYIQFFSTSMEILSVTTLEQNGVIRIHWRLKGLPQTQNLKFWRLFQSRQSIAKEDWEWLEAFSYFHIGKDGLVHKHRIDRMMPDNENELDITEKLRGLLNPAKPLVS